VIIAKVLNGHWSEHIVMQVESVSSVVKRNLELMKTLDDAWNAGPSSSLWETFRKRHTENVAVYWPGGAPPTVGRHNHDLEAVEFFKTFPDNHLINNPYKISQALCTAR